MIVLSVFFVCCVVCLVPDSSVRWWLHWSLNCEVKGTRLVCSSPLTTPADLVTVCIFLIWFWYVHLFSCVLSRQKGRWKRTPRRRKWIRLKTLEYTFCFYLSSVVCLCICRSIFGTRSLVKVSLLSSRPTHHRHHHLTLSWQDFLLPSNESTLIISFFFFSIEKIILTALTVGKERGSLESSPFFTTFIVNLLPLYDLTTSQLSPSIRNAGGRKAVSGTRSTGRAWISSKWRIWRTFCSCG